MYKVLSGMSMLYFCAVLFILLCMFLYFTVVLFILLCMPLFFIMQVIVLGLKLYEVDI